MQADFYEIPALYDALHTPGTAREVTGLERLLHRFATEPRARNRRPPQLFEPACGTARHLRVAAARGLRVAGIDLSEPMIRYAERSFTRRGLTGTLLVGDMTALEAFDPALPPGGVDLAFCLINSIRHLPTDAAMLAHLRGVRALLAPRGVYAVGINFGGFDRGHALEMPSEDVWHARRGGLSVAQTVQYLPPETPRDRSERVISVLQVARSGPDTVREQTIESSYTLRTYTRRQWERAVADAGLRTVATVDEDGRDITVGRVGYAIHVLARA